MIARDFPVSGPDLTKAVPQPAAYARAGWYPATWTVRWDRERAEYLVSAPLLAAHSAGARDRGGVRRRHAAHTGDRGDLIAVGIEAVRLNPIN